MKSGSQTHDCVCMTSPLVLYALSFVIASGIAFVFMNKSLRNKLIQSVFRSIKQMPGARGIVEQKKQEYLKMMQELSGKELRDPKSVVIPKHGSKYSELLNTMDKMRDKDCDWKGGHAFGIVYHGEKEFCDFLNKVYAMFAMSNPLHTSAFPSVQRMDAEVVRMTANMLHGDEKTFGTTSSGGTESLLLAVKTYRDWARHTRGITEPEMVIPSSVHAAFWKAATYFGVKPIVIDIDDKTKAANVQRIEQAITKNTILIAGSAPCYPFGVIDDIPALARIAQTHNIGMHVDSCLGGFLLPWAERAGHKMPLFDFRVPGVTSISADLHKYGFASKGVSCVVYSSEKLCMHQFFAYPDWHGGVYASPTMAGSRPGGVIATAWASLQALGEEGFIKIADQIMNAANAMRDGVRSIDGLCVPGNSTTSAFAIASDNDAKLDVFMVGEALGKRGWYIERQQYPNSLHVTVTFRHVGHETEFLKDLKESVQEVKDHPERFSEGMAPVYGMAAKMPDRELVGDLAVHLIANMYRV